MKVVNPGISELLQALSDEAKASQTLVHSAYDFARKAHEGQQRRSGEPYITHCVAVAYILADMKLDATTIAAALLHDVVEDTGVTHADLEREFGPKIAELVDGVTQLKQLPTDIESRGSKRDREMEYLQKMFLAMANDFRVILIKLADRLHNMRTLGHMPYQNRIAKAQETLDIFAPIANRLGIWQIKWELEDLAFRYLEPDKYRAIADNLNERRSEREAELTRIVDTLKEHFARAGIKATITGRPKHIYSIFRKMERKNVPFDEIYDVRAFRVIVASVEDCYRVLGIIHSLYRVIPQEFDDYISSPKENAYRSLHTAVVDKDGKTLEVQIRTDEMDEEAQFGIAAHWRYKENRPSATRSDDALERRLDLIRRMMEDVQETGVQDANTFVQSMMEQISPDRIYALTPKGDIIDLPEGATPVDFAYYVHTEVGHRCRGAKVNGRLVSLDYQLKNGDRVEITTANRGGPSLDWLNPHLGYIKTTRARNKIKQWFKRRERDKALTAGKEVLDRELRRIGQSFKSRDDVAAQLGYAKAEDLMLALGTGEITAAHISPKLLENVPQEDPTLEATVSRQGRTQAEGMRIDDTDGLLVTLAGCCNPTYGDPIVGFITRGKGITVHRHNCKNVLNTNEPERIINVTWPPEGGQQCFPVPVVIVAYDREGLMRDIGAVIADEKINMSNVNISTRQNIATFELTMEIRDVKQLSRILTKIERLPNVVEAVRRTA